MRTIPYCLLLVCACAEKPPDCVTASGVALFNSGACESLEAYQQTVIAASAPVLGLSSGQMADLLASHVVTVEHADRYGFWHEDGVGKIAGQYVEDERNIRVGMDDWRHSAFAHEVMHAIDAAFFADISCTDAERDWVAKNKTSEAAAHCSWNRRGIWKLVNSVAAQP